jgi:predicted acyl esterase
MGHTFLAGHSIRVEISSSATPDYFPNQNTGNPVATDTEWRIAHQTIYHVKTTPSHIVLPIMKNSE